MDSRLHEQDSPVGHGSDEALAQAGESSLTPAQLNLTRLFEQDQQRLQKNMLTKAAEHPPDGTAKGKPRLLLMGQRRYDAVHSRYSDE